MRNESHDLLRLVRPVAAILCAACVLGGVARASDVERRPSTERATGTALPIIPGAAGFGMETAAGSGRHLRPVRTRIIRVTNLKTEGPGSLRAALETSGPRTIVFEVSGNIDFRPHGGLQIRNPYVTVAGQTAPSPGITLKACELGVNTHDVLIRHIRIRSGDLYCPAAAKRYAKSEWTQWSERDCMKVNGDRVVIDHCSFSWATDENVQSTSSDLSFTHCIFGECLHSPKHHKGPHSRNLLIAARYQANGGQRISVVGNLFAHTMTRNPVFSGGCTGVTINNLVYDCNIGPKCADGGHKHATSTHDNVLKRTGKLVADADNAQTKIYFGTHLINGSTYTHPGVWKKTSTPFGGVPEKNRAATPPVLLPGYRVKPAQQVERWVLTTAGARPADRDPVDARIINDVVAGTGKVIKSQDEVGGWPELEVNTRRLALPSGPFRDDDGDGYTNLEEWLHAHAAVAEGRTPPETAPAPRRRVTEAPAPKPTAAAVNMWDERLRARLREELVAGKTLNFYSSHTATQVDLIEVTEAGDLKARGGPITAEIPWPRLTLGERKGLAVAAMRDGFVDDHLMAAFYLRAAGDETAAREQAAKCGEYAPMLKGFFTAADAGGENEE